MQARFLALAALLFGLAACQTEPEGLDVNLGGEQEVMLTVSLPEATRADSAQGFDLTSLDDTEYSLRYILEIYRVDGENIVYDTCQRFVKTSDFTTMAFPVKLVPGRDYRIVAWADIVVGDSEDDRCYYTQEGLDNVVIKDNGTVNWNPMDETRDAYTGTQLVENFNSSTNIPNMTLTRPFAKLRVVSTDIKDVRELGIEPASAVATYSQPMYYKYNALTATAFDAQTKSHEFTYVAGTYEADDASTLTLFADYIFVNEGDVAKFSLNVVDIKENHFNTDIFVQRNTLTTIKGDVLTLGENIVVNVDGEIKKGDTHAVVNSAEDLQDAIDDIPNNDEGNITLGGNIDLSDLLAAGTLSTRANETAGLVIPAGKSVTLDLNGYTISQTKEQTGAYAMINNKGTLTIEDSSANKSGKIAYGDTGNGGNYASNTISNSGVLTINGGTIENNSSATVASNGYPHPIDNSGVLTINGGTFTNNANYSSMRIWTSNTDAEKCVVVINGGTFNGCIDFQAHNNNNPTIPHYGTLTVTGGTFNADTFTKSAIRVLRFGVNAEDMHATIKGGCFNGKVWVRNFGTFDSTPAIFSIEGGSFSTLSPIVYLADNCTYTLNSNIENAETVVFKGKGTLDLNGKTVSAYDNSTAGYALITNNGTLNITGEGTLKITGAANDRGWSAYSSVISNSTNGILTVGENVTIEHLGGTSMAYGIDVLTNGGIGDSHATVYGTVQSTYRAIRQFLNSDSKMNTLIVKEGAVINSTGGNKAIWMQDPSKKANKGTLTVEGGASVHSVYLDVTEGSTEWPVEVSVAASSLTDTSDNKGIYTDGIPAGYSVVNENGVWKVNYNPYYDYEFVADGVVVKENEYVITNANGMFWFADEINSIAPYTASIYDTATFKLGCDIDLNNQEWTPIGDWASQRTEFHGVFDGQNYTIKNLKISKQSGRTEKQSDCSYGLFGNVANGTIKNVTVENASISNIAKFAAVLVGRLNGNVDNCHVRYATVTQSSWQGGVLVGQYNGGNISNCSVTDATVSTGVGAIGAIAGYALNNTERTIENCRVSGCTLIQTEPYGAGYDDMFATILGGVHVAETKININGCTATNNTIKGKASNQIIGYIEPGAEVYVDGNLYTCAETTDQLEAALKAGGNVSLVNNVTLTKSFAISNANFTLNGNGYTISQAAECTNTYALFDITGGKARFENVTFDGVNEGAVIRTVGVEFTADNVTAKNGSHTQQQGIFRLMGKSTIKNCTFKDNTCNMVITLNYDGANNDPQVVENCAFKNNTCNATAVLYYVKGASATINGNKFIDNTVNCSGNGATVYMGFTENNVVTNNLFQNNTVNEAGTSSRVAGGIFFGYETVFTGNAFVGNNVTGENAKGNDVCVSTYYTSIDLSGNYWGGNAPVEDTNYFVQHKSDERVVTINDYLTVNPIN